MILLSTIFDYEINKHSVLEKTRKEHADYKENAEYKINNIERIHKDEIAKQKVQIDQMVC